MYSYEEQCVMDLSDNYTLLYSFLGREVLDAFGVEGERAFREGTRREHIVKDGYARPRGVLTTAGQTRNVHRRVNPGQRCCSALEYGLQQAQR